MGCAVFSPEEEGMKLFDRVKGFAVFFIMAWLALLYPRANGVLLRKAIKRLKQEGILKGIL